MSLTPATFPPTMTLPQGLSLCGCGSSLHPRGVPGHRGWYPLPQPQNSIQLPQDEDRLEGQRWFPSLLLALLRSVAELSGTVGPHGAVPAHPSMGRKLKGRQIPGCPSQGEPKASSALPQAVPCLSLLLCWFRVFNSSVTCLIAEELLLGQHVPPPACTFVPGEHHLQQTLTHSVMALFPCHPSPFQYTHGFLLLPSL